MLTVQKAEQRLMCSSNTGFRSFIYLLDFSTLPTSDDVSPQREGDGEAVRPLSLAVSEIGLRLERHLPKLS